MPHAAVCDKILSKTNRYRQNSAYFPKYRYLSNTLLYIIEDAMRFFLTAKAWQVFLLIMASMFVGAFIQPAPANFNILMLSTLVFMAVWAAWLWSIANASNNKLEPPLRKSPRLMVVGLVIAASYLLMAPWLWPDMRTGQGGIPALMVPMHLLAMLGIFYALVFTANRLTTLERKQQVSFFDYSGPFFLLWFFPIGIWFIQPRVNKLLGNDA